MLIDGNSLTYRAFFALPTELATASGQVTNAVYGFTSMLLNLLRDHEPDRIVVAFDRPEPTFRHERVDTYKANRDAAPDILRQQMGLVREVIAAMGLPTIEQVGYEADDLLATLATTARDEGSDVIIVTGDRDAYQLVEDPHVRVLYNKRGVADYALYDEAGIADRTGVAPSDYVAYAALRGDKSDNLPGVPGVGEKTAARLINTYGGIDGIYGAVDEQTPKLRENLAANETQVRLNLEVMELVRDVPLEMDPADLVRVEPDVDELRRLWDFLEFHSLHDRLTEVMAIEIGGGGATDEALTPRVESLGDANGAVAAVNAAPSPLVIEPVWEGEPARSPVRGVALVVDTADEAAGWIAADTLEKPGVLTALGERSAQGVVGHDGKALLHALLDLGVPTPVLSGDTTLAAYLLDPAEQRYDLDELLGRYANRSMPDTAAAPEGQLDLDGTGVDEAELAGARCIAVATLAEPLTASLRSQGLAELYETIEIPLVGVLTRMERVGIGVDVAELKALNERLVAEAAELRTRIHESAGHEFNVNSTKQLREVLFEELELTPQKKTKTGYSTDAASLEKLVGEHPIIEHLLRYREVEKLRSTYGEGLLAEVGIDDRIHAAFNQTVARTGRLSSDRPNLHNIPVRTEEGRAFRRAFVPAEGFTFLVADYNQIELRCIAHLAEDPGLIGAFEAGDDIHTATASRIFDVDPDDISIEQRSKAKMVSYGLAYGMEAYGLAQRLSIPVPEAEEILDSYFEAFPAVRDYMDRTVAEARDRGYTETLFGRRRQIPELSSSNYRIRQAGERQAMNAGIQGLAADIFKVALVRLDEALAALDARSRVVLQVHDEVIVEMVEVEREEVTDATLTAMQGAFDLRVDLAVNLAFGSSWAEAKSA